MVKSKNKDENTNGSPTNTKPEQQANVDDKDKKIVKPLIGDEKDQKKPEDLDPTGIYSKEKSAESIKEKGDDEAKKSDLDPTGIYGKEKESTNDKSTESSDLDPTGIYSKEKKASDDVERENELDPTGIYSKEKSAESSELDPTGIYSKEKSAESSELDPTGIYSKENKNPNNKDSPTKSDKSPIVNCKSEKRKNDGDTDILSPPSSKSYKKDKFGNVDIYGVKRGECTKCNECEAFLSNSDGQKKVDHVECLYCGCRPINHKKEKDSKKNKEQTA